MKRPGVIVIAVLGVLLVGLLIYGVVSTGEDRGLEAAIADGERPPAPDHLLPVLSGEGQGSLADYRGQIAAIHKAQAVIEFELDGVIRDANENFLAVMGYTLAEVKGQHHGMFAEPVHRASPEYRTFWEKLGRGEHDSGVYKRIGKGGKEVVVEGVELMARCLQHEVDHLDGMLYLDRLERSVRKKAMRAIRDTL